MKICSGYLNILINNNNKALQDYITLFYLKKNVVKYPMLIISVQLNALTKKKSTFHDRKSRRIYRMRFNQL